MSDHTALLAAYRRVRLASTDLNTWLIKQIPKAVLTASADRLGLLSRVPGRRGDETLVFENEYQMSVLMDYCIYHVRQDGKTAIERALADAPPRADSEAWRMLHAMQAARYCVFSVEATEPEIGVQVRDLLRDTRFFLVDIGMGNSTRPGMVFAGNVITLPELTMSSGAMLPVDRATLKVVQQHLQERFAPLTVGKLRRLAPQDQSDLAGFVIHACLAGRATSHIVSNDVAAERGVSQGARMSLGPTGAPVAGPTAARKQPRNAPCACGSGKKYKLCCGR